MTHTFSIAPNQGFICNPGFMNGQIVHTIAMRAELLTKEPYGTDGYTSPCFILKNPYWYWNEGLSLVKFPSCHKTSPINPQGLCFYINSPEKATSLCDGKISSYCSTKIPPLSRQPVNNTASQGLSLLFRLCCRFCCDIIQYDRLCLHSCVPALNAKEWKALAEWNHNQSAVCTYVWTSTW